MLFRRAIFRKKATLLRKGRKRPASKAGEIAAMVVANTIEGGAYGLAYAYCYTKEVLSAARERASCQGAGRGTEKISSSRD